MKLRFLPVLFLINLGTVFGHMVKKMVFILVFVAIGIQKLSAQIQFGQYSEEELSLTQVSFEPDARIVTLWEEANSYFMVTGLHTNYHFRYKVLDDNVDNFGDIIIPFYRGKSLVEDIGKVEAQVSYIENGQRTSRLLTKENIKEVNIGNGQFEIRLIFPNVKKGSIIEYKYRKIDHQYGILEGWSFQGTYPALVSKYTFKAPDFFQYQMIQQGKKVAEVALISPKKNLFSWERRNVPSLPNEPYVGNYINFEERVDGYLYSSEYVNPDKLEESDMVYATWNQLANRWLEIDEVDSYTHADPETIPGFPSLKLDSLSKLDQAKTIFEYVSNNIELIRSSWLEPFYSINGLLQKKEGNSIDKNLMLTYLLRRQGIAADMVLINDRFRGRSQLIEVPFINQFLSAIVKAKIEDKDYLLDASDSITPFGLLSHNKLVERGFILEKDHGRLEALQHQFRSGSIQNINLEWNDSTGFVYKNQIKLFDHEALKFGKLLEGLKADEEVWKKDTRIEYGEIENFSVVDELSTKRSISISFNSKLPSEESNMIVVMPFQYSEYLTNPFIQQSRVLPVEYEFPAFENINATIPIPEGYVVDDYPEPMTLTIPSKKVKFTYQSILGEKELKFSSRIELSAFTFSASEYQDLKFIMESISVQLNSPITLRKVINP
ncbi:DUF3857 domain-containing protein [Algoriphagus pacificus]|uniref:DUF3857 domain-containing protein n=1 Tax=Algoriphagus pacificus TaxID=2811234 RepID=A0ABS3CBN4_9BACT|nr:DUF3857 domain-containing protein [Algoriphagus pacificus]MBN7814505.1 DUF3857 domain-containing protein [Algoriphagus pacificus]